jgi:purine-nucleoside phosphorylase
VIGNIGRLRVAVLQGRSHYYESGDPQGMRTPIEVLLRLGAHSVVLTSSVGSTKAHLRPGAMTIVTDHLNLSGVNPLIGEPGDARFVALNDAYDPALRHRLKRAAASQGALLNDSVYMFTPGPSFETPAEIRMAAALGADVVGMSVVPEAIIARRYGLKVAAICAVTNLGAGLEGAVPSHNETKRMAATAAISLRRIFDTPASTLRISARRRRRKAPAFSARQPSLRAAWPRSASGRISSAPPRKRSGASRATQAQRQGAGA